ncbi:SDR family oxidoreductase [Photobacterium sp. OFAV2-7]|uniref:SDR family oxidoreductase n=1 Tax=Photobacterium sp. OFAV2-7 TaxID=2917748 RepID=UPI001EF6D528|nr:SDR family oxidoreductase [Photobacterium sp. OFAV2-7]MCG7587937.1 SDR family oxidoreductase [Photobacterium sp. OFAV2-7]
MTSKVVMVTGGAKGIGRGICEMLTSKEVIVIAVDIDEDAGFDLVADNPMIRFRQADVTRENEVAAVVEELQSLFGRLDGLVNNAAIANPYNAPVESLEMHDWERIIAVNLTSPMLVTKLCLPLLKASKGAIVNISSTRAEQSEPNTEAYSASKGGLVSLSHALAVSLGPDVRVNCVSPGWIDTSNEELRDIDHSQHLTGRVGHPADVASMVKYLLSTNASFISGQNFTVDGGITKKMIYAE